MAALNLRRYVTKIWAERRRLASFFVIGLASLGLNIGLYALFSRVVWPSGPRTFEYTVVVILVTIFNFEANRSFTFSAVGRSLGTLLRFASVAVISLALNSLIFWFCHTVLHLYDLAVIVIATLVVAVFTFSSHRLFTFHSDPWRHVKRLKRGKRD